MKARHIILCVICIIAVAMGILEYSNISCYLCRLLNFTQFAKDRL